jgi:hypothetical protein
LLNLGGDMADCGDLSRFEVAQTPAKLRGYFFYQYDI